MFCDHLCPSQGSDVYLALGASQDNDTSHHHHHYKQLHLTTGTKLCYFCAPNGKLCSFAAPTSDWSDEDWDGEILRERERRKKDQ